MYAGEVVEVADTHDLFLRPTHPYTQGLLDSIPRPGTGDKRMIAIAGRVPPATEMPDGCRFHPRCPYASLPECASSDVDLVEAQPGQHSRCLFAGRLDLPGIAAR
jgi:oligopeptide/dipeptide ABC transporter ATP-binding protein